MVISDGDDGAPLAADSQGPEVLAAFTSGWQPLKIYGEDSEDVKAGKQAATGALRDELGLITNADWLVVLAGLGTSLGIERTTDGDVDAKPPPTMGDLWADVSQLDSFKQVSQDLNADFIAAGNLEYVLSDAQTRLAIDPGNARLTTFMKDAEDIVWDRCNFVDENSDVETHQIFLRKVARRSTRLQRTQLFTTNYDLAFETAARRARFHVIDGFGYGGNEFDGSLFDIDYVRRRPHEQIALDPSVFHLLKLHGSVDWDASRETIRKVRDRPDQPVLIYPSEAKYQLSYTQPYLEFMSRFQIMLRQSDVGLIIVGFGFNDSHLSAPVQAAIRSNVGLRMVVVTPGIRSPSRSPTIAWLEDLIQRGDRRITMLRGTFDDLVLYLPEIPLREERDLHADRIGSRSIGGERQ